MRLSKDLRRPIDQRGMDPFSKNQQVKHQLTCECPILVPQNVRVCWRYDVLVAVGAPGDFAPFMVGYAFHLVVQMIFHNNRTVDGGLVHAVQAGKQVNIGSHDAVPTP
jgi:hypothetical protein